MNEISSMPDLRALRAFQQLVATRRRADPACGSVGGRAASTFGAVVPQRSARLQGEVCELCSTALNAGHAHLVEVAAHRIVCACDACALLFDGQGAGRYCRIPRDAERLHDFAIDDAEWESLSIPIGLAFFFFSSVAGRVVALYPSPAGATESLLPLPDWQQIAARSVRLQRLRPDVEALLVNRLRRPAEFYIAPIDRCYELTGIVRSAWQGISGGDGVWRAVHAFFDGLQGSPWTQEPNP